MAIAIGCYDRWTFPKQDQGFSGNIDELLLLVGLGVLAGVSGLFSVGKPPR